jgi:hypothetical protein
VYNSRAHYFIRNSYVCVSVPSFALALCRSMEFFLGTLITGWLGYSSLGNSLVVGDDFETAAKYFERNLRLPFTPPLVTVFGPSFLN